ncbi:MAG: VWA domain-containing protein [Bdellovibrionota bacterium]|nr:VWA domain-containing protein [Bdellovibrionota bacterium]
MTITNYTYLYSALLVVFILVFLIYLYDKKFFTKVKRYWFYERSKASKTSFFLFVLSLLVFAIALGDIRGREELVKASIPNQKTVLLIDSSASMMVEDVRPFRLAKAAIIARHFIRNSFGHQVSIAVFSDIQRKIVPFTDDLEILESRLEVLLSNSGKGSSNVNLALKESFQYFYTKDGYETGNVLLITDGEQHSFIDLEVPEKINLAVVGIGTESGGKIPIRNNKGNFVRYKKWQGKEVTSKLDKRYFESLVSKAKYGKVWYAGSYALPTKEILSFFDKRHKEVFTSGQFKERPVKGYVVIKIAIVLYILSVLIGRMRSFSFALVFLIITGSNVKAQNYDDLFLKLQNGTISKEEKLKLSEFFLQNEEQDKALTLYNESLNDLSREEARHVLNYGTLLFKNKKYKAAVDAYDQIDQSALTDQAKDLLRKNKLAALKKMQQEKKQQQNKNKNKDNKNQEKNQQNQQGDQEKEGEQEKENKSGQQKQQQGKGSDKSQNKKQKQGSEGKEEKEKKEKKDGSEDGEENEQDKQEKKKQKQKSWDQIKDDIRKKKNMSKVKGVLKQIVDDDRNIKKKFMKTSRKRNNRKVKDW